MSITESDASPTSPTDCSPPSKGRRPGECSGTTTCWSGSPRARGQAKKRALRVIDWFMDTTTDRRYEILDRQFFDGGFVQQHVLHATGRNGGSIAMRVCIVIKLGANGLITRIDEYFDPAEMAPLLDSTN